MDQSEHRESDVDQDDDLPVLEYSDVDDETVDNVSNKNLKQAEEHTPSIVTTTLATMSNGSTRINVLINSRDCGSWRFALGETIERRLKCVVVRKSSSTV